MRIIAALACTAAALSLAACQQKQEDHAADAASTAANGAADAAGAAADKANEAAANANAAAANAATPPPK